MSGDKLPCKKRQPMRFQAFRDFEDGEMISALGFDIVLHRRSLGELSLPSGELIACDPIHSLDTEPFSVKLEPAKYPVYLIIAELRDEKRVAYAVVDLRSTTVSRWERANLSAPAEATIFERRDEVGFASESSLGAFVDAETAAELLNYHQVMMPEENDFERHLWGRVKRQRRTGVGWAGLNLHKDLKIPTGDDRNLIAFDAGYGDGYYDTYIGRDGDGKITSIVTDFEVLELRFPSFPHAAR